MSQHGDGFGGFGPKGPLMRIEPGQRGHASPGREPTPHPGNAQGTAGQAEGHAGTPAGYEPTPGLFGAPPSPGVYPAPGYPQIAPGYVQPIRKDKTLRIIAFGCLGLFLVVVGGGVGVAIWGYFKAKSAFEAIAERARQQGLHPDRLDHAPDPTCVLTVRCCTELMQKLRNSEQLRACSSFILQPRDYCEQQLQAYEVAAKDLGITCQMPSDLPALPPPADPSRL